MKKVKKKDNGPTWKIIQFLLSTRVPFHSPEVVVLVYLEAINCYVQYIQHRVERIPLVLNQRCTHHQHKM